jgi:Xaa-Pro aminopeptidase
VYRQDADFFYLTGVSQPDCLALFQKTERGGRFSLLVPPHDARDVTWHGPRLGAAAAVRHFGADEAVSAAALGEAFAAASSLYWAEPPAADSQLAAAAARFPRLRASPLRSLLSPQRWRKSEAEQALLRRSAQAAAAGLRAAAAAAVPGATEASPAAAHEAAVRRLGAQRLPYPSVVAGGARGAAIHYGRYDGLLTEGDTLLMDAGAELHGYVSDVTRTWPLSRRFGHRQRALYDAVRSVHAEALAGVRPGASLAALHAASVESLSGALAQLGVLAGPSRNGAQLARSGAYRAYYPTALGHFLGLDTHDTAGVALNATLEPGCVLTIEPGLYLRADDMSVAPEWRGLAVRIEDDVLVTERGCEVLSSGVPVDAEAVEDWAHQARQERAEV